MLQQVWDFLTEKLSGLVPYISPFWYEWLPWAALVILVACVIGWFFAPLRQFAGGVVLAVIAFLVGFWKGEDAAGQRYKKEIAKLKQKRQQPQNNTDGWKWW